MTLLAPDNMKMTQLVYNKSNHDLSAPLPLKNIKRNNRDNQKKNPILMINKFPKLNMNSETRLVAVTPTEISLPRNITFKRNVKQRSNSILVLNQSKKSAEESPRLFPSRYQSHDIIKPNFCFDIQSRSSIERTTKKIKDFHLPTFNPIQSLHNSDTNHADELLALQISPLQKSELEKMHLKLYVKRDTNEVLAYKIPRNVHIHENHKAKWYDKKKMIIANQYYQNNYKATCKISNKTIKYLKYIYDLKLLQIPNKRINVQRRSSCNNTKLLSVNYTYNMA